MAPNQVVSEKEPDKIRLTMLDGDEVLLEDPWVSAGEILAHPRVSEAFGFSKVLKSDTLRVPTDSVARIEVWEADAGKAVAIVFGVALGLTIGLIVAANAFSEWGRY